MRANKKRDLVIASVVGAAITFASWNAEAQNSAEKSASADGVAAKSGLNLVTGEGRSAHFDAVASRLHLGGSVFGYMDVDGDVEKLAGMLGNFLAQVPKDEMPPHIANLDLARVLGDLGIDGVEAMGMSSFKSGELYHNRAFMYVPEGRQGLLKVFGGDAGPFVAGTLAPADADLVIEQTLNLRAVYEVVSKMVKHFGGEEALTEFMSEMGETNPQLGLSMAELFGKLDTRITMVGRVHPDRPLEIPDAPMEIPSFDFLIALDDMGWVYEKVTGGMKAEMPADQVAGMFVKGEGFERIAGPPMPSPDMVVMQPVVQNDLKTKRVYLASSQAYLDECLSGKTTLADGAGFKDAMKGLPTEGNGMSYVSSGLMKAVRKIYTDVSSIEGGMGANELAIMSLMSSMMPKSDAAQAKVTVNEKDGIFMASNSTTSVKEGVLISGVTAMVAVLSGSRSASSITPGFYETPLTEEMIPTEDDAVEPEAPKVIPVPSESR